MNLSIHLIVLLVAVITLLSGLYSIAYTHLARLGGRCELPEGLLCMGAFQVVTGFVTAPGTTVTPVTLAAGDSLQVLNSPSAAYLLAAWGDWQGAGFLRIRSPRLHDNNTGITLQGVASEVYPLIYPPEAQPLVAQDTLIVEMTGSGTAGDIETMSLLMYYEDLPGSNGNYISYDELIARAVQPVSSFNTLALGTAGGYSGGETIISEVNEFKGNTFYALVGYNVNVECATVCWRGTDTGNLRIGGPGNETNKQVTRTWFADLARMTGRAAIPVFNSANFSSVIIDGAQDENGADPLVTSIWMQLR